MLFHCQPPVMFKYMVIFISFCTMVYFITMCCFQYAAFPTQTRVSIRLNRSQTFPAVTICSGNPLRVDKYLPPLIAYLIQNNLTASPTNISRDEIYYGAFNFLVDLFNRNKTDQILSYGFQWEDILLDCTYNGYDCRKLWLKTMVPILGNCYTFNRQTVDRQTALFKIDDLNGETQAFHNGLIMTFYLNVELYFPIVEYGLGLTAILHNPDEQPLIRFSGKRFAPGFEYNVVYDNSISTYLGSPYTACTQTVSDDMRALYSLFDNNTDYVYSETVCLELCYQKYMYEQCGCVYSVYFLFNRLTIDGNLRRVPVCTPWTPAYRCTVAARQHIANDENLLSSRCGHCQAQCIIHKYTGDISSLKGPSDAEKAYYAKLIMINSTIPIKPDFPSNASYYLDRNYLKLSVVPLNAYVTKYEERATYTWSSFISDLGGQIGLWLGVSVISIFELFQYLYSRLNPCRARKNRTVADVKVFEPAVSVVQLKPPKPSRLPKPVQQQRKC